VPQQLLLAQQLVHDTCMVISDAAVVGAAAVAAAAAALKPGVAFTPTMLSKAALPRGVYCAWWLHTCDDHLANARRFIQSVCAQACLQCCICFLLL